jgi:type IV pilus assembly protein PilZ
MGRERREFLRVTLNVLVEYANLEELRTDLAANISSGGLFIRTDTPLAIGTDITVHLVLPDESSPLALEATVMHTTLEDPHASMDGMGVRFKTLAPEHEARINALVSAADNEVTQPKIEGVH